MKNKNTLFFILPIFIFIPIFLIMVLTICGVQINKVKLEGSTVKIDKPSRDFKNIMNGTYQQNYEKWLNDNFFARNIIIKFYNQFRYSLFNVPYSNKVIIGKDDYLFENYYVYRYYGRLEDKNEQFYEEYAKKVKYVQDEFKKNGKIFIYFISPSKVEIYSDKIPNKFEIMYKDSKNTTQHEYLIDKLNKYEVLYYDSKDFVTELRESGVEPYAKTGIHWNYYSASLIIGELIKLLNKEFPNVNLPNLEEVKVEKVEEPVGEDADLYGLLNIINGKKDSFYYYCEPQYENIDNSKKLNANYFGTSFGSQFCKLITYNNQVFNKFNRYYYLGTRTGMGLEEKNVIINFKKESLFDRLEKDYNDSQVFIFEQNAAQLNIERYMDYFSVILSDYNRELTKDEAKKITINSDKKIISITPGKDFKIPITMNNSSNSVLISYEQETENISTNIICDIYDSNQNIVSSINNIKLSQEMLPNEKVDMTLNLFAPKEKGEYKIKISLIQDNVCWFDYINFEIDLSVK